MLLMAEMEPVLNKPNLKTLARQDIQREAGCHVGLPGSWPKNFVAEKVLVNKILLTRTFLTTSNLLPRAF